MADNFQIIPNPDNVPGGVSTGYQRQNTNIYSIQTGLDTTSLYQDVNGNLILKAGGTVEYNGALYKILTDIDLTDGVNAVLASNDYCYIAFDGTDVTPTADKGLLVPDKRARYLDNKRLLNVSLKINGFFTYTNIVSGAYNLSVGNPYSVAYGGGVFVAINFYDANPTPSSTTNYTTYTKKYSYSTDGINWTLGELPISTYWKNIFYVGDKFIALGGSNISGDSKVTAAAYSTDGINWTNMSSNLPGISVAYGNNMYVTTYVNGSGSTFKYSTNGINWTQGSFSTSNIRYVTFVNGKFLASQIYGDNSGIFYYSTSTDGVNWTSVTQIYVVGTSSNIIYFVKDKFFQTPALNNKLGISTDGITDWEFIDTPVVFNNIICVNNKFYGFSEDNFMSYSSDGYDWSKPVKNLYLASSNKIYDGNKIVSVGCNLSTNFNNMFCTLFKDKKEFDIGMFIPENNYYVFSDLVIEMTD